MDLKPPWNFHSKQLSRLNLVFCGLCTLGSTFVKGAP